MSPNVVLALRRMLSEEARPSRQRPGRAIRINPGGEGPAQAGRGLNNKAPRGLCAHHGLRSGFLRRRGSAPARERQKAALPFPGYSRPVVGGKTHCAPESGEWLQRVLDACLIVLREPPAMNSKSRRHW